MGEIGLFNAAALSDDLLRFRRELHRLAELSGREIRACEYLERELKRMRIKTRRFGTGLTADIKGKTDAYVALCADMDALPVAESSKPYAAETESVGHVRGHDGQMAILLAVASVLAVLGRDAHPSVRLLFQSSGECGGGAQDLIDQGALNRVKLIFGLHLSPDFPIGAVATRDGGLLSGAVDYQVVFCGEACHVADDPRKNALLAAAEYAVGVEKLFRERYAKGCRHGIGCIRAGSLYDVVSRDATVLGMFRYYDDAAKEAFFMDVERLLIAITEKCGVDHRFKSFTACPPVINSPELTRVLMPIVGAVETEPRYTAEDFACYLRYTEGAYFWLGVGDERHRAALRSSEFDFDERALVYGVRLILKLLDAIADNRIEME